MRSDNMPRPFAPEHSDTSFDIVSALRKQSLEIALEGINGWGNTTTFAADEIERLREVERKKDGVIAVWRRRYDLAEAEWERLREEVAQLRGELTALKAKIEAAPVATCDADEWFLGGSTDELLSDLDGKRVRLMPEEE